MSWSTNKIGVPSKVKELIRIELTNYKCLEPEETLKQTAIEIIDKSLSVMTDKVIVSVEAYGSQSSDSQLGISNSFKLEIKPIFNFVS